MHLSNAVANSPYLLLFLMPLRQSQREGLYTYGDNERGCLQHKTKQTSTSSRYGRVSIKREQTIKFQSVEENTVARNEHCWIVIQISFLSKDMVIPHINPLPPSDAVRKQKRIF